MNCTEIADDKCNLSRGVHVWLDVKRVLFSSSHSVSVSLRNCWSKPVLYHILGKCISTAVRVAAGVVELVVLCTL